MIAHSLYAEALARDGASLVCRDEQGCVRRLPLARWLGRAGAVDERVLDRAVGPVLDVGCGPGRHVSSLARRGVLALGVDVSPVAVRLARARGAKAIERSIFARLPGAGTWGSALVLDGNIGIGGRPDALLRRVADLLALRRTEAAALLVPALCLPVHVHASGDQRGGSATRHQPLPVKGRRLSTATHRSARP
jgi:SAM-dependent methyltransferase